MVRRFYPIVIAFAILFSGMSLEAGDVSSAIGRISEYVEGTKEIGIDERSPSSCLCNLNLSGQEEPAIQFISPPTPGNGSYILDSQMDVNLSAIDGENNISSVLNIDDSLLSWWRMDDSKNESGDVRVRDIIGENNGSLKGNAVLTDDGIFGEGVELDGSGSYIDCGNSSSLSKLDSFTVDAWVKTDSEGYIAVKGNTSGHSSKKMADDFSSNKVGTLWQTNLASPSEYRYSSGQLEHGGDRSSGDYFSTKDSFTVYKTDSYLEIRSRITKKYSCSDHYFMIVDDYDDGWSWGTTSGQFKFCWNCNSKYIYGPDFRRSVTQSTLTTYDIKIHIYENKVGFYDSRSGWLNYSKGPSDYSNFDDGFYVSIGADDDSNNFSPFDFIEVEYPSEDSLTFALSTINGGEFMVESNESSVIANSTVNDGNWHHIAGVKSGSNLSIYVDGEKRTSKSFAGISVPESELNLTIGSPHFFEKVVSEFDGIMDDVRLFSRALTDEEISSISNFKKDNYLEMKISDLDAGSHTLEGWVQDEDGNLNRTGPWEITRSTSIPGGIYEPDSDGSEPVKIEPNIRINVTGSDIVPLMGVLDFESTLKGWWRMEEIESGVIIDQSSSTNNLTGFGSPETYMGGIAGNYINMDGTSDYLVPSKNNYLTGDMNLTYATWFRTDSGGTLISEGGINDGWVLKLNSTGHIIVKFRGPSGSDNVLFESNGAFNDKAWHQIVLLMSTDTTISSGNHIQVLIDGSPIVGTLDVSGTYIIPTKGTFIGSDTGGSSPFWNGCLDDMLLFKRCISDIEISALGPISKNIQIKILFSGLQDDTYNFEIQLQNKAGAIYSLGSESVRTEYYSTEVTVPRPLWKKDAEYKLMNDIDSIDKNHFTVINKGITFDMKGHTIGGEDSHWGIRIVDQDGIVIKNGRIGDFGYGILIINSKNVDLVNLDIENNQIKGIKMENSGFCVLSDLVFKNNHAGIGMVRSSDNNHLDQISFDSTSHEAVEMDGCSNSIMDDLMINDGTYGVKWSGGRGNYLYDSTISDVSYPVFIENSHDNVVRNLTTSPIIRGFTVKDSTDNWFDNIISTGGSSGLFVGEGSDSNLLHDISVSGASSSALELRSNSNLVLEDITLSSSETGLHLFESSHNTVNGLDALSNENGVKIVGGSNGNIFTGAQIKENTVSGLSIHSSDDNRVSFGEILDNYGEGLELVRSEMNIINYTTIESNLVGVKISASSGNILESNLIRDNHEHGVKIDRSISWGFSENNWIVGNNLIRNNLGGIQAADHGKNNGWNSTSIGNYWSDWTIPDNEPDGIVDMPYELESVSYFPRDQYPRADPLGLTKVYTPTNRTPFEDHLYVANFYTFNMAEGLIWDIDTNARWLTIGEDQKVFGTPRNEDVGSYKLNVSVSDGVKDYSEVITLVVMNTNDDPVVKPIDPETAKEDEQFRMQIIASDEDPTEDRLMFSLISDLEWLEMNQDTGLISGVPRNEHVGSHTLKVAVRDGCGGYAETEIQLEVTNTNDPPEIVLGRVSECYQGKDFNLEFSAFDMDPVHTEFQWKMETNSTFLILDGEEECIRGSPGKYDVGDHKIVLMVSDGMGGEDESLISFEVLNVNDIPQSVPYDGPLIMTEDTPGPKLDLNDLFIDPDNDDLIFDLIFNDHLSFKYKGDDVVVLIPERDWSGECEVTVRAYDGISWAENGFDVVVEPTNDVPYDVGVELMDNFYREGEVQTVIGHARDKDLPFGDELEFMWTSNISGDIGRGEEIDLDLSAGVHMIILKVVDLDGASASTGFTIEVLNDTEPENGNGGTGGNGSEELPPFEPGGNENRNLLEPILIVVSIVVFIILLILGFVSGRSLKKIRVKDEPERKDNSKVDQKKDMDTQSDKTTPDRINDPGKNPDPSQR